MADRVNHFVHNQRDSTSLDNYHDHTERRHRHWGIFKRHELVGRFINMDRSAAIAKVTNSRHRKSVLGK
ncbi:hypothetical protein O9929_08350 [Vibrio lentus]|nr:hypothetical protein [Vibrio lentus]